MSFRFHDRFNKNLLISLKECGSVRPEQCEKIQSKLQKEEKKQNKVAILPCISIFCRKNINWERT